MASTVQSMMNYSKGAWPGNVTLFLNFIPFRYLGSWERVIGLRTSFFQIVERGDNELLPNMRGQG